MANFRFAVGRPFATSQSIAGDFVVPTSVSASSTATGYSPDSVRNEDLGVRWVANTGAGTVTLAFASSANVVALLIEDFNAVNVSIGGGTTSGAPTGTIVYASSNGRTADSVNKTSGRGHLIGIGSSTSPTFWGVSFSGGTVDGANYYLGRMSMVTSFTEIAQNFGIPYSITSTTNEGPFFTRGGTAVSPSISRTYSLIELNGQFDSSKSDNTKSTLYKIARCRPDERILFYENRNDSSGAYLTMLGNDVEVVEAEWPLLEADVVLREVV